MLERNKIDLVYRIICLLIFSLVIICVKSFVTLLILVLFFLFVTKNDSDFNFVFLYLISFIAFFISYTINSFGLLKLMIIIDYVYYFLNISSISRLLENGINKIVNKLIDNKKDVKGDIEKKESVSKEVTDTEYIRFKNLHKENKKVIRKADLATTLYVTLHLSFLFISIMVG